MTSASELFYNRRSRISLSSDPFPGGSDFVSNPASRRHRTHNTHSRRDRLGFDHLHRPHHHPPLHRPPRERDGLGVGGNERLPGAVLLARERLLQRLRGVTLSSDRRSNRIPSGNNISIGDDFGLVDAGDWETEISREKTKRPPGLTQEALSRLCVEVFSAPDENNEHDPSRTMRECSICLEGFSEGDKLIRLSCWHRYHFNCLEPWARTCGDCPYCRRGIEDPGS